MQNKNDLNSLIEAALYASNTPLSLDDLTKAAETKSKRKILMAVRSIAKNVNFNLHSIEIVELPGNRFVMQLKPQYNRIANKFAIKPLVSFSVLKTLSYIVHSQPVSSHDLAIYRGSQVYRHLKLLNELGFIKGEQVGRNKIYRTTSTFSEYFGLSHDPKLIKEQINRISQQKGNKKL
jgi:segregation and condensation protein B